MWRTATKCETVRREYEKSEEDAETNQESPSIQASEDLRARVAEMIERERDGEISAAEKSELDHYLQLEHEMRLTKARALTSFRR